MLLIAFMFRHKSGEDCPKKVLLCFGRFLDREFDQRERGAWNSYQLSLPLSQDFIRFGMVGENKSCKVDKKKPHKVHV